MSDDKYEGLGLSDEEIAAMEAELSDDEQALLDAQKTDDDDSDDDGDDTADDAQEAAGEDVGAKDEPDAKADPAPAQTPVAASEPEPSTPAQSALDGLNAELVELKKKFDEGDIAVDEYIDERDRLSRAIVKAELKAELAQDAATKSWEQSQKDFLGQHKYLRDNDVVFDAFAMQVNKLLADLKSASMSDEALLSAAREKVDAAFGIKPTEPSRKKDESPVRDAKKEAADRGKAPKTIRDIPAAAPADDVEGSQFAYLDRLSGDDLEAALMKLSDADQRRYAHSQ